MATYTSYLNLEKPTTSEMFNLLKMNQNWDKIDLCVSALNSRTTGGYENVSLYNGFVGTGSLRIIRMGHLRVLFGAVRPTNAGADQAFALLSQSDRPPIDVYGSANAYDANAYTEIVIGSNGAVNMSVKTVPNNTLKFNITYYV